ncbi:MAG: hypothetical protein P8Y26_15510, partial [Gemmatimonadales bacterium]
MILFALERRLERRPQLLQDVVHVRGELGPLTRRHEQRDRTVGFVEVVDVADVRRNRLAGRPLLQELADDPLLVGLFGTQRIDVESGLADPHPEPDRVGGALLPYDLVHDLQIGGRLEIELLGIAAPPEGVRREGLSRHPATRVRSRHSSERPVPEDALGLL